MKKKKSLKYLVGGVSLAAELLLTSCSSSPVEDNKQIEIIYENENDEIESPISDGNKESSNIENETEISQENLDEFAEERKIFEDYYSNGEIIYKDEYKSIDTISIDWNIAGKRYEMTEENGDIRYEINLLESNLINFLIHQTNCQKLNISHDKDERLLSSLTECSTIKSLVINACNISSLDGIENLPNLETLVIKNCKNITDLSPIKNLTNINTIIINGTRISDISVLSNLSQLSHIDLRCNEITNPEVLESLENITSLDLEFNKIEDKEQLRDLIEKGILSEIQADNIVRSTENNRLKFSSKNCEKETYALFITYLDSKEAYYFQLCNENQELVGYALTNEIGDSFEITKNLTNCKGIKLANFPENAHYLNIANEKNFDSMVIDHCDFSNVYFLEDYSGLTYLSIDNCPNLVDAFDLPFNVWNFDNLKTLSVVGTNINNFDPLAHLVTLEEIQLKDNNITSFNFLTKLPNLKLALIGVDNYPVNADPLVEILCNGVNVKVTGYHLPKLEENKEDELTSNQEQGKILELTSEN